MQAEQQKSRDGIIVPCSSTRPQAWNERYLHVLNPSLGHSFWFGMASTPCDTIPHLLHMSKHNKAVTTNLLGAEPCTQLRSVLPRSCRGKTASCFIAMDTFRMCKPSYRSVCLQRVVHTKNLSMEPVVESHSALALWRWEYRRISICGAVSD